MKNVMGLVLFTLDLRIIQTGNSSMSALAGQPKEATKDQPATPRMPELGEPGPSPASYITDEEVMALDARCQENSIPVEYD